jgi:hypothetical protein
MKRIGDHLAGRIGSMTVWSTTASAQSCSESISTTSRNIFFINNNTNIGSESKTKLLANVRLAPTSHLCWSSDLDQMDQLQCEQEHDFECDGPFHVASAPCELPSRLLNSQRLFHVPAVELNVCRSVE